MCPDLRSIVKITTTFRMGTSTPSWYIVIASKYSLSPRKSDLGIIETYSEKSVQNRCIVTSVASSGLVERGS